MWLSPLTLLIVVFWTVYFGYHANVRLRFKLACCLGSPWTRDGVFIVALYLPWCRALESIPGVGPQLYADNLKCVSGSLAALLSAARFTGMYIRLVGQEAALPKCVFLSTSKKVRDDMKCWSVSDTGDKWSVRLDIRDLGGHLDSNPEGQSCYSWLSHFYCCSSGSFCCCPSFVVGFVFFVRCICLLRFMVLKPLLFLFLIYVGSGLLLVRLLCPVVCV